MAQQGGRREREEQRAEGGRSSPDGDRASGGGGGAAEGGAIAGVRLMPAGIIAFLSLVGVASALVSPVTPASIAALEFGSMLRPSLALLVLLPVLPVVYTAALSRESFRRESFASIVGLAGLVIGPVASILGIGIAVTTVLASRKASAMYNGHNSFYAIKSTGGTIALVFALVAGLSMAYAVTYQDGFRDEMKQNLAETMTEQSMQYVSGVGEGAGGRNQRMVSMVSRLGRNASSASIRATKMMVFRAVQQSDGFSAQETLVLNQSFSQARSTIPDRIASNLEQRLSSRLEGQQQANASLLRSRVEQRVETVVDNLFAKKRLIAAGAMFTVFSTVTMLKYPLALLVGLLGLVIVRLQEL